MHHGLWVIWREDFLAANPKAKAVDGVFGTEIPSAGRGVRRQDGAHLHRRRGRPRWMLRGIFSGTAASDRIAKKPRSSTNFLQHRGRTARAACPTRPDPQCISRLRQASTKAAAAAHPVKRNRGEGKASQNIQVPPLTGPLSRIGPEVRPRCRAIRCSVRMNMADADPQQRHRLKALATAGEGDDFSIIAAIGGVRGVVGMLPVSCS